MHTCLSIFTELIIDDASALSLSVSCIRGEAADL